MEFRVTSYVLSGRVFGPLLYLASLNDITVQHTKYIRKNIVDSFSIRRAETKYALRIQFLALVFMIYEVWLHA